MSDQGHDNRTTPSAQDPLLGQTLSGRYRIDHRISAGGMGTVYSATHLDLDSPVAVKVLHAHLADHDDAEAVHRFLNEAKVAARLSHPNIVRSLDLGRTDNGIPFFVLELLEGSDLLACIAEGRISDAMALYIAIEILRALEFAHAREVIHRDIKPANIFLTDLGDERPQVKVLDFGIAKLARTSFATSTGNVFGTPQYMSPEQFEDAAAVDRRTDLYAVGVMLYEMLSGQCPFNGNTYGEVYSLVVNGRYEPLKRFRSDLPEALIQDVSRAFSTKPEERFDSARQFRECLREHKQQLASPVAPLGLADTLDSRPSPAIVPQKLPPLLRSTVVAVGAFVLVLALGGLSWFLWGEAGNARVKTDAPARQVNSEQPSIPQPEVRRLGPNESPKSDLDASAPTTTDAARPTTERNRTQRRRQRTRPPKKSSSGILRENPDFDQALTR